MCRNKMLTKSGGFTLIELLVVISILGVLASVVVLNVIGFIDQGSSEAKAVELKQVHTAAGLFFLEGNRISSAATVGPGNKGILSPWLIGDLKYYWTINSDGSVYAILFSSSLNSLDGFTSLSGSWIPGADGLSAIGDSSLVATGGNWDDFTFQTTATFEPDQEYGMYYRSDSDASSGYFLQFDPEQDKFVVSTIIDGVKSAPIASSQEMGASFGGQHSISISVSGSSHTVKVDGSTVMTFQDSTYDSGTVGLQSAAGSAVNFTSFTVSPP